VEVNYANLITPRSGSYAKPSNGTTGDTSHCQIPLGPPLDSSSVSHYLAHPHPDVALESRTSLSENFPVLRGDENERVLNIEHGYNVGGGSKNAPAVFGITPS
jgi:hypothetical protein